MTWPAHALSPAVSMVLTRDGCQYIPGTKTKVGAGCLSRLSYPTLVNPQKTSAYGADPTGITSSTTAFHNASSVGDVYVDVPGTYNINNFFSNGATLNFICAPGVTLKDTRHSASTTGLVYTSGMTTMTISGCDFQGGNAGSVAKGLDANQSNYLIGITDSSNLTIEGNTFENTFANAAVWLSTGSTGPGVTGSKIQYNTFSGSPYYGPVMASGSTSSISNNLSIDGPVGVEDDGCATEPIGTISVKNNMAVTTHGDCALLNPASCDATLFITGGDTPSSCNYSTNTVSGNYVVGNSIQKGGIENSSGTPSNNASYSGDILGPNSICVGGSITC
jgi:hypothetical protein